MKYTNLSKTDLLKKIEVFEHELKGYVNRVDQRYKVFYERNLAGIYRTSVDGEMLDCNEAMAEILGYDSSSELVGANVEILYNNIDDRKSHLELLRKNKFIKNRKLSLRKKDGSVIWVSISTSEIINPKTKKIEYLEGTVIDITELIETQEKLIASEENYRKMLDESPYGILIHKSGEIKYFNKRAEEILGLELQKKRNIEKIFPKKLLKAENEYSDEIDHFDRVEVKSHEKTIFLDVYLKKVLYNNETLLELSFVDIKDRIELEEERIKTSVFKQLNSKLKAEIKEKEKVEEVLKTTLKTNKKQSAKLEAIFENSSHVIWTMDKEYRLTSFNTNLSKFYNLVYNLTPSLSDKPFHDYKAIPRSEKKKWISANNRVFNGESINFITENVYDSGNKIFMNVFLNPIFDDKNQIIEVSGIAHNISDKVLAEGKLTESLREKEVLIKEIHHRVKNNLQVISSIFNLQSAFTNEERIKEVLRESQNRIKSMAYIHESLYKTSNLGQIDFEQYVKELGKNLIHSYAINDRPISLLTETESVYLDLDIAIPCGLIVNELISNSLKHAFVGRKQGIIGITLKNNQDKVKLRLSDDGIGIESKIFNKEIGSLGIQLVQTLSEQIKGVISVDNSLGTSVEICFPFS